MLVSLLLTFHCCLTGHWLIVSVVPKNPSFFDEEAVFPWRPQLVLASFSIGATTKYSWTWRSSDNLDSQNLCWLGGCVVVCFAWYRRTPVSFSRRQLTHVASWTPVSLVLQAEPQFHLCLVVEGKGLINPRVLSHKGKGRAAPILIVKLSSYKISLLVLCACLCLSESYRWTSGLFNTFCGPRLVDEQGANAFVLSLPGSRSSRSTS